MGKLKFPVPRYTNAPLDLWTDNRARKLNTIVGISYLEVQPSLQNHLFYDIPALKSPIKYLVKID